MKRVVVDNGQTIIREGASGDFFYVVLQGTFNAYKEEFGTQPIAKYNNGGSFGELALMYNCPRAATVVAKSRGVLFKMDRHTFKQMVVGSNAGTDYIGQLRSKFERQSLSMHTANDAETRKRSLPHEPAGHSTCRTYKSPNGRIRSLAGHEAGSINRDGQQEMQPQRPRPPQQCSIRRSQKRLGC